ncbi:YDG domain-containing protein, partial [Acinetobacter bouvetii]|uniref:YDG domain-containing protein n=1 Tax=Acinetobacter bouvetii TaxID=202951 RepID=UPI00157BBE3A
MNKIYKVIWNAQLGCWQAVSELAKNHSASHSSKASANVETAFVQKMSQLILFGMALLPLSIHAAISNVELPTGAHINSGSASFNQNNNTLNINQNTQHLSTNWNSFNIGQDATVNFNQPTQSSVAINHVLDSNASQIMGRLNANGQVFLLNPNGVVFSKTAQVNVGGLVASTLNLNDADIYQDQQNGTYTLKGDANSTASIENHGSITSLQGGTVALIAPNVKNTGTISTLNGTTHLTSASQVTLALQDGSLTQYQVDQGVLQGLVDNGGAIIADNGAVYLTAKAKDSLSKAVVNHSGIIEANRLSQNAKGEIILLGDMQSGETHVSGTLKAEGKNGADGGFIETSAAHVEIAADTKVSTASDTAKSGLWLIDPVDITIDSNKATAIQTALSSGDVTVTTADGGSNTNWSGGNNGTGADKGDIHVNSAITWSSNQALTLHADNDININADITATGATGKLNLKYGQSTANGVTSDYYLHNGAKVNLKAGQNFNTQKGSDTTNLKNYTVITSLGATGSTTGTDLQGINGKLSGNYVLGADIDASATSGWNSGAGFQPIGSYNLKFNGDFLGLGHEIKNLFINRPNEQYVGLFGYIENSATNWGSIRDLHLKNANIAGHLSVGGLAGSAYSVNLNNVLVSGKVKAVTNSDNAIYAGGIFGNGSYSKLDQVSFSGEITAEALNQNGAYGGIFLGGLLGWSTAGSFNNVETQGKINGKVVDKQYQQRNNLRIGGLVGQHQQGIMTNAKSSANIVADTTQGDYSMAYAGGLVGYSFVNIYDSEFSGTLTANGRNTSAGGILGHFQGNRLEDVKNYGSIKLDSQYGTVGGIAGSIYYPIISFPFNADLINVENYGNITAKNVSGSFQVGGLVGQSRSSIQNSKSVGTIDIQSASTRNIIVGGLVGTQMDDQKSILSSSSSGTITINSTGSEKISAGAIIGHNTGTLNLNDLVSDMRVNVTATNSTNDVAVGGIVGLNTKEIGIIKNHYTGEIISNSSKGPVFAGGLVGRSDNTNNISQSSASSNVTANGFGDVFAGGLVGHHVAGEISDSQASGNVSASSAAADTYVGGLIGLNRTSKITQVSASGNIKGKNNVGGLIGANGNVWGVGGEISSAYATGTVLGTADYIGGLVGSNQSGTISNVYATGLVTGQDTVGGLVGTNVNGTVSNSYATGVVSGEANVGGIAGENSGAIGNITNIYSTGNVTGKTNVGGVVGNHLAGSLANAYATGLVFGQSNVGGLVGLASAGTVIQHGFWDTKTTGQSTSSGGGTGLTTAQMQQAASFTGFDIDGQGGTGTVWRIYEGQTTPLLRSFLTQASIGTVANQTKIYNGQLQGLDLNGVNTAGLEPNKLFSNNQSSSKNVGTYHLGYYSNQQGYDLIGGSADLTITPATLTATMTAQNKVYDAGTSATVTYGDDRITGDVVTVNGTANFSDKNVANGKVVTATGLRLSGADAGNYVLASTPVTTTANITPATLTATMTAQNKVYDAGTSATVTYGDDRITGDVVTINGTANFSDKNVANGKVVTATGLRLSGADAGNYVLASTIATNTANITPATLTATMTAQNKVYDAGTSAIVRYGDDRITGDVVTVNGTANFSDKNVANGKVVTATGLRLSGADAGNYVLAS